MLCQYVRLFILSTGTSTDYFACRSLVEAT